MIRFRSDKIHIIAVLTSGTIEDEADCETIISRSRFIKSFQIDINHSDGFTVEHGQQNDRAKRFKQRTKRSSSMF